MQRGRFLILIGILLAVMAAGLLLVMSRKEDDKKTDQPIVTSASTTTELIPTAVPPTPVPTNLVLVAQQNIDRGTHLVAEAIPLDDVVGLVEWPETWVTQEALKSLDDVEGRMARSDIPRGTVLTAAMFTDDAGELASTGSDAALLIPRDRVAVALPVDHISSVGWSLRRGDHVDVLVSFLMIDLDEEFQTELPNQASSLVTIDAGGIVQEGATILQGIYGRIEQDPFGQPINVIPSDAHQRARLVSQVTVRDAEVLNIGPWGELFRAAEQASVTVRPTITTDTEGDSEGSAPDGDGGGADDGTGLQQVDILMEPGVDLSEEEVLREYLNVSTAQPLLLVVSPQDALVLKWADESGAAMHVVLRSFADAGVSLPDTEAVTLQYMVDRFNIALPPGLAYGTDPAVEELERGFLDLPDTLWNPWSAQTSQTEGPPR